jgi:hypothetical protein
MSLPHIQNNDSSFTVIVDNKPVKFDATHPSFVGLCECVSTGDADEFKRLIETGSMIEDWSDGSFKFTNGELYYEDEQVASEPVDRIVKCLKGGYSAAPVLNYLRHVYLNDSARAVKEGYNWSSHNGIAITEAGMLVGYKGVRSYSDGDIVDKMGNTITEGDLVDIYTGNSFRNNIGDKPSMRRRQVCDDHTMGCSSGLHVGTYDYACQWAGERGVVVLVSFNPKDIVSVPSDCCFKKIRVSEYEVMQIAREQLEEAVFELEDEGEFEGWDDEFEDEDEGYAGQDDELL